VGRIALICVVLALTTTDATAQAPSIEHLPGTSVPLTPDVSDADRRAPSILLRSTPVKSFALTRRDNREQARATSYRWTLPPRHASASAAGKSHRSLVKRTLVGAAIGAGGGAGAGVYYAEAEGDVPYGQSIAAFSGMGAAVGALTGLIVGLF
jgi:hypothetical protein